MKGSTVRLMNEWRDRWKYGWMNGWKGRWKDRQMIEWMEILMGKIDRQMKGWVEDREINGQM